MADTRNNTTRIYFARNVRRYLGLTLYQRNLFLFVLDDTAYISTTFVPKYTSYKKLKAKIGKYEMFVDIPTKYVPYEFSRFEILNTKYTVLKILKK